MKKAPLLAGPFLYPKLPGNTITTGHTCLGSSETEVEPTYLGRLPLDSVKPIPSALFKIIRRPQSGEARARHEQDQ